MKHEFHKGPTAAEQFEKLATAMFRAPKFIAKPEVKPAPKRKKASKGWCLCLPWNPTHDDEAVMNGAPACWQKGASGMGERAVWRVLRLRCASLRMTEV